MSEWRTEPSFTQWNFIKSLAGSDIAKFVTAIPIVGYLILFNDGVANSISFDTISGNSEATEKTFFFSSATKLRLAFFGSTLILLANFAFRIKGPKVLSHSENDLVFCERVISSYSNIEIASLEDDIVSPNYTLRTPLLLTASKSGLRLKENDKQNRLSHSHDKGFMLRNHAEYIRLLAREWWAGRMHSRPFWRYFTLVSALAGYTMLSASSFDILQAVVRDLIG